jgi:serine/threonine-protein kinase
MAQVWEATDEVLARRVAVKLLHPHLAADESFLARFRREAVAAARLSHPAIVSIYDTCADEGCEAIVMELVEGRTLRELLDERRWLEPGQAVAIIAEVADALETAHRAGVVHRDIKPANILLSDDGRVLVADFGIAKAGGDATTTNNTLGTVKYLAPEQVEGAAVDARTDVYALGIVLYEALCGRPPFVADTDAGTALARLHRDPMRPRNVRAGVPKPLEDVVLRAMARDPDARFESASAFRAALLAAEKGASLAETVGRPSPAADQTAAVEHPKDDTPAGTPPPTFVRTERGWLVPTIVIALIAAAAILAGVLVTGNGAKVGLGGGTNAPDAAKAVAIKSVAAFDPPPGDGQENNEKAALAADGNPDTAWDTEGYNSRTIGTKPGVGLIVNLQNQADLKTLVVTTPSNDWAVEVYVAAAPAADLGGWGDPVTHKEHIPKGQTTFDLGGHTGGAVLIWLKDLGDGEGDSPGKTHGHIAEVAVFRN